MGFGMQGSGHSDLPQGFFGYAVYLRYGLWPEVRCMSGRIEGPGCAIPYDGTTSLIESRLL